MKGTKRFAAALTAVFTASALVMSASAAAHNYRGDINRDDKVDGTDVVYLQKYIANKSYISDKNLVYADVNGDGNINVIDLILLKRLANNKATPEEVAVTTPAVTTVVTTTSTTSSTAAPTKVSTSETTKATMTITTTAKATTAATTKATTKATTTTTTTKATTKATTTTTTTKATTKATTTTTTTKVTTKATTTTTTTTTKATTASTTKATTLATVNNGRNSLAAESADRGWIVLGGDASQCDYVSNASDFLPGSVRMPAITGDGTYIAEFYITDEALAEHDGGITYASLDILKGGTWSAYSMEEKPNLKVTVTGAIIDGRNVDVSGLTQKSGAASVHIESILGMCNSVNLEFKVEGFNDTAVSTSVSSETTTTTTTTTTSAQSGGQNKVAATNVVRGNITLGGNASDCDYVKNINDFVNGSVEMPEISGSGTYTAKFTLKNPQGIYYAMLDVLKPNSYDCYTQQDSGYVSVKVKSAKVNGEQVAQSKIDGLEESTYFSHVNITDLFFDNYNPINIESLEITFEVSAPSASGSSSGSSGSDSKAPSSGSANIAGTDKNRLTISGSVFGWGTTNYTESEYASQLGSGSIIPEITGDGTYTITVYTDKSYSAVSSNFEVRAMNGSGKKEITKANYPNLTMEYIGMTADGEAIEPGQVNDYNWGNDSTGFNIYNPFMSKGVNNFFTVTVKISGLDG
jgi:hypothetical protein